MRATEISLHNRAGKVTTGQTTLDPMSCNDVTDLENVAFVIEGEGGNAPKNCFGSEIDRHRYPGRDMRGSGRDSPGVKKMFGDMAEHPDTGSVN